MATNAKNQVLNKLSKDRAFDDKLATQKKENEIIHKGVLEYKTEMHEKQKEQENKLKVDKDKRNPFNAKINQQSLANATKLREKKQRQQMDPDFFYEDMDMGGGMDMLEDGGAGADIESKLMGEH